MKITCESCSAQYDLDDNRIPPSGLTMKCPACLHSFTVKKGGPAKEPPPPAKELSDGIALSDLSDFTGDEQPELPAPVGKREDDSPELPAPVTRQEIRSKMPEVVDLPAPRAPRPPPLPPKKPPPPPPELKPLSLDDELPAPVTRRQPAEVVDLPAPKAGFVMPSWQAEEPDLLAPKGPSVGIGLDAPEADDLLEPVGPSLPALGHLDDDGAGPPPIDLDHMDVVAPKEITTDLEPKLGVTDLAPKPEEMNVTPQTMDVAPVDKPQPVVAGRTPAVEAPIDPSAPPRFTPSDEDRPRRVSLGFLLGVGGVLLVGAFGVSLGLFTSSGFFGVNLITGHRAENEAKIASARKLLAEDTLLSYRRAANDLHPLVELDPADAAVAALEAQARLAAARLGISAESKNADKLLQPFDVVEKVNALPDMQKARALRLLVAGKPIDARTRLTSVLQAAPADASALVYLGWTELSVADWQAADKAFAKAVAAESNRAAAIYGLGVAKEHEGDRNAAREAYEKTLSRSPNHFGAQVALARLGATKEAQPDQRIADLIEKRASMAGPRELAEAWAARGAIAADAGRRDEAEDRLKRALGLDPESTTARMLLARVQCDLGRASEAVTPMRKLLMAQPKNLDVRLTLLRALLEGKPDNYAAEAATTLAPAVKEAPKDARVLYWQGRMAMGGEKVDREGALAKFKAAVETDPKLIPAYLAESAVLSQLGRSDDALEVLKQAGLRSADDAQLQTELGAAYLSLGKAAEAEAQLRGALEKRPEMFEARMFLGGALEAQSKLDEAQAAYDAVAAKSPKYPGLLERKGKLALRRGNKAEAWKMFAEALGDGIPTASLRLASADLALELGKVDDAQRLAELVVKEDDRSPAAHLVLAKAALAKNRPDDALPEARRAAVLSDSPEAHLAVGRALEAMNKLDQAVSEYQLARRGGAEAEATLGRARIMVRLGASKDALSELQALVRDNKLRAPALMLMGDCYTDLQQADKARHAYEDAVKYGPQLGEAAFKFGRSLHDAGRRKPAIEMLDRALKLSGDQAPFSAEAYLLLGDSHREMHEKEPAVKAYKRFLELAPPDSPSRPEVQRNVSILGGG